MGLLRRLFGKNCDHDKEEMLVQKTYVYNNERKSKAEYYIIGEAGYALVEELKAKYIALDLETTGFKAYDDDRIIEIGAARFENGIITDTFQTFVNPQRSIPEAASAVNNITDAMVACAPTESVALKRFLEFLGDAMSEGTILVAHNADFDLKFIKIAMERCGYPGKARVIDTLDIAKAYIKDVPNHKQVTIAKHFGIIVRKAHRAQDDAMVCGKIMQCMIPLLEDAINKQEKKEEKRKITEEEFETCAVILNMLRNKGISLEDVRMYKTYNSYIDACYCNTTFAKFKHMKKGKFIILPANVATPTALKTEPSTKSEGGEAYKRLFFTNPLYLSYLEDLICSEYQNAKIHVENRWFDENDNKLQVYMTSMKDDDIDRYLQVLKEKDYYLK